MNILAIIPARAGSKSVPNKNIRIIGGKPMLAHSVQHAIDSKLINRVILSTDSEEYAAIGREYGAETPFIRPSEYATDTALDIDVFEHALKWLKEKEGYEADIVVQLRPTYPKRNPEDIDKMISMLIEDAEADSVRSIALAGEIPYKMWRMSENGEVKPLLTDVFEGYNMPRQELPTVYYQNACIDVMRGKTILEKHSMTGEKILGYVMTENLDIDTEAELEKAKRAIETAPVKEALTRGGKRFVFDIDGVIAKLRPDNDYSLSEPNETMIARVNQLYDAGNEIILFTARGYVTGKDWREVTEKQMKSWGVRYHELHFGKPNADYYIDDKNMMPEDILNAVKHFPTS